MSKMSKDFNIKDPMIRLHQLNSSPENKLFSNNNRISKNSSLNFKVLKLKNHSINKTLKNLYSK